MEENKSTDLINHPILSKEEYESGCIAVFRKLTDEQYKIFTKQLADNVSFKLDMLRILIDDDALFLQILDALAGENISFPKRKQLFQYLDRTFMYTYAKNHEFTEEAFNSISKHFGEKLAIVKNRVLRISELLDGAEYATLLKAQEKLKAQRRAKREENRKRREERNLEK